MKMFHILIIQLPAKGRETEEEEQAERRNMFRPRPNNKELLKYTSTVTPSHSWCITHCSLMFHPAHILLTTQCHHKGGAFVGRQQPGNIWHCFCVCVFVCVRARRSPQSDKLRTRCLSWEEGRVTVVTVMPKLDLLCLVQLLDGTIQTFNVSVCNSQTHTQTHT